MAQPKVMVRAPALLVLRTIAGIGVIDVTRDARFGSCLWDACDGVCLLA